MTVPEYRRKSHRNSLLFRITLVGVLGIAAVVAVLITVDRVNSRHGGTGVRADTTEEAKKDKPRMPWESFPPSDWTQKELADYLRQKGFKVEVRPTPLLDNENRTTAGFALVKDGKEGLAAVHRYKSQDQAKVAVGAMGEHGIQFGHFAVAVSAPHSNTTTSEVGDMKNQLRDALR